MESAVLQVGDGHTFPFPEVCIPGLAGPAWLQRFQVLSSSQSSSWLTVLTGGSDLNQRTVPSSPFTVQPSTLPGQMGLVSTKHALNLASLLAGQLRAYRSSLFFSSTPLLLPHCTFEPLPAFCTLHLPKRQKVFLCQGWPQHAGASDSLRSHSFSPGLSLLALQ